MLIYRLQDETGNGPYSTMCKTNKSLTEELAIVRKKINRPSNLEDGSERYMHPDADAGTPLARAYFDKLLYPGSNYVFGFATLEHLYIWYDKAEIIIFENFGFNVYEYNIPDDKVISGSRQVIFKLCDTINCKKYKLI